MLFSDCSIPMALNVFRGDLDDTFAISQYFRYVMSLMHYDPGINGFKQRNILVSGAEP